MPKLTECWIILVNEATGPIAKNQYNQRKSIRALGQHGIGHCTMPLPHDTENVTKYAMYILNDHNFVRREKLNGE